MELFVACLMTALTVIVAASRGQAKDTSMLWASVLISLALILNVDPMYVLVDRVVGGRNYADLAANLILLVGVYFLARAIHRAASPTPVRGVAPRIRGRWGLVVASSTASVSFFFIAAPATSTAFMHDYGSQLAAGLYSAVQYIYIGAVMASAGWTCVRFRRAWNTGIYTTAFALVGLGCLSAVMLVIHVLVLDTLHLLGDVETMSTLSGVYSVLNLSTFILLCTGLAMPPARRKVLTTYETARTSMVLKQLRPVWGQAVVGNAGLTLDLGVVPDRPNRRRRELHRMIVEIQDSLARDPEARHRIGATGLETLTNASEYLTRLSWRPR